LLTHFSFLEKKNDLNNETLDEIISQFDKVKADSSEIDMNYKEYLDNYSSDYRSKRDLNWFITKDIERKGKISQVNRTIKKATGDIVVFSDANSMFNEDSILNLIWHFRDPQVGCVAGEKRIKKSKDSTSGDGEGLYWKYESFLKKMDSDLYSAMGAAGEIYAVRKELLDQGVPQNAIIEDFILSMKLIEDGYRIVYEPNAYAEEEPTYGIKEEYKRRARIAAGGFQSILILWKLLNPFVYRIVTFQYLSHRVLRWAVVPFLLPLVFIINAFLLHNGIYLVTFSLQVLFYVFAFIGYILELYHKKIKLFNIPLVFMMMNVAAYSGLKRLITKKQTVLWEKSLRVNSRSVQVVS
jgi:cellulose synthase/poly-beta-1,6-N-acetylglucosamine synthase-like glycosyltransferase